MDDIERLEQRLADEGVIVDYNILKGKKLHGLYVGAEGATPPVILINKRLPRRYRRAVLAEEVGHHYRSCGPALGKDTNLTQRKNELVG